MRVAANRGEAALAFAFLSRRFSRIKCAATPPLSPAPLMAGVAAHNARCTLLGFTIIRADASLRMASQISSHDRAIFNFRSDNYLQLLRTLIASSPRGGEQLWRALESASLSARMPLASRASIFSIGISRVRAKNCKTRASSGPRAPTLFVHVAR